MEEAGFKTDVRRETSDTVDEGRVISTRRGENTQLEKGRTVVLVVSSGPEQVERARRRRRPARTTRAARSRTPGLRADVTEEESEDEEPGTVLRQDPGAGDEVDKGSTVDARRWPRRRRDVDVPDVVDQTSATRRSRRCATRASRCGYGEETVDTLDQDGIVIDQDPAGGEQLPQGLARDDRRRASSSRR